MCARRRTYFLLLRQKKVGKEKATLPAATPSLRYGATCAATLSGCAAELATRFALRSDSCSESDHEAAVAARGTAATPPSPRRRRIQKG